ncbi:MAG: prepilin peptidase [Planctomycetaceae bacterium]|nr:prepilin peptidase [Planctomycetaceae bacterium]MBV8609536.1 prepilin peptidase [Singulisphaera sp.]
MSTLAAWVALAHVLVATGFDLRSREVPNTIPVLLLGWAIVVVAFRLDGNGWGSMLVGLSVGLLASGFFFALGGLGGGDVKLIAALGAVLGHPAIWPALFWIALAGGGFSLIALIRGRRDLAYLPAIALGLSIHLLWQLRTRYACP